VNTRPVDFRSAPWRIVGLGLALVLYAFFAYLNYASFSFAVVSRPPGEPRPLWSHALVWSCLLLLALAAVSVATLSSSVSKFPLRSNVALLAVYFALPALLVFLVARADFYQPNAVEFIGWSGCYIPIGIWAWKRQLDLPLYAYAGLGLFQSVLIFYGINLIFNRPWVLW